MCNLQGSFIPFAPTKAARQAIGDPRPSLEERYGTAQTPIPTAIRQAAARLVEQRFLLPEDANTLTEAATKDGYPAVPGAAAK